MGTTLTGTTPQDTYDSLIKVTDNGPLGATAKYLSDGLGNDSTLALSTGYIGMGTTSLNSRLTIQGGDGLTVRNAGDTFIQLIDTSEAATNYIEFKDSAGSAGNISYNHATNYMAFSISGERMRITSAGNVGIGTSSPSYKLDVSGISSSNTGFLISSGQYDNIGQTPYTGMFMTGSSSTDGFGALLLTSRTDLARPIIFGTSNGSISVERVRIDANGLKFNGDTAAANALDDYEEGTFTPTVIGATTAGTTTYTDQNGYYTKIGRQVNVTLFINYSSLTGTGDMRIGGLPFVIGNFTQNYPVGPCIPSSVNWTGGTYLQAIGFPNESNLYIAYIADDAASNIQQCVDEAATFRITMTYFTA